MQLQKDPDFGIIKTKNILGEYALINFDIW